MHVVTSPSLPLRPPGLDPCQILYRNIRFKVVSKSSEKTVCALPHLFSKFQSTVFETDSSSVGLTDDDPFVSFPGRPSNISSSCTLRFLANGGVMSVDLCQPIVSQVPQHFRSSATQVTCGGCFSRQSVYSVISLHSDMSRAVHPQETSRWIPNTYAASLDLPVQCWLYENSSAFSDTHDTTSKDI